MSETITGSLTKREAELISEALQLGEKPESKNDSEDLEAKVTSLQMQLAETKKELEILYKNMPGGIMTYDADTGRILYVNDGLLNIFGCEEEVFRKHYMDSFTLFVMKDDRVRIREFVETQIQFFEQVDITYRVLNLADEITWINHRATVIRNPDGSRVFFCILTDITDQKTIQNQLQLTNELLYIETERFKLIEEAIDNIEYDYDVDTDTLSVSKKDSKGIRHWKKISGAIKQGHIYSIIHREDTDVARSVFSSAMKSAGKGIVEYRMPDENGMYRWYRLNYASFDKNERIIRIVGSAKDITEEKIEQERLRTEAERDGMTGLLNKMAMQLSVKNLLMTSDFNDCHALFMIDTDNFKSVNDTLGHGIGDDTIRFVADNIKNVFRDTDYIGRMGGDEFMVLMSHTTVEVAEERAKRLNDKIRSDVCEGADSVHISCSIGIAFFAKDGEDYDSLFRAADDALYEAKEAGKDCYRIYVPV
ncbi:MAG: diguanylate cyclase [Lachnospiraceae bacterium]|nr:diguanylate cyclase [Lachnospiraceae bacterium]